MPRQPVADAVIAEGAAFSRAVAELDGDDLARPSPCSPWTVGELVCHVLVATDRVRQALAEPVFADGDLVSTVDYYRPDQRFSAATNAGRIATAQALAEQLTVDGPALAAELDRRCAASAELLMTASADRVVRTRHGDRMLLSDFGRTRVVELGVHGLDVAIGIDRQAWLTDQAATILEELLLPGTSPASVSVLLGCDRVGLIARLTGRAALAAADEQRLADLGVTRLALG